MNRIRNWWFIRQGKGYDLGVFIGGGECYLTYWSKTWLRRKEIIELRCSREEIETLHDMLGETLALQPSDWPNATAGK